MKNKINKPRKPIQLSGCVIIRNGKLLLLFKDKHKHYEFPGGKVNNNETLMHAAIRETKEEIGCDIELIKYLGHTVFSIEGKTWQSHNYLAKINNKQTPKIIEPDKFSKIIWMPIKDYRKYAVAPNVRMFCESLVEGKIFSIETFI